MTDPKNRIWGNLSEEEKTECLSKIRKLLSKCNLSGIKFQRKTINYSKNGCEPKVWDSIIPRGKYRLSDKENFQLFIDHLRVHYFDSECNV